MKSLLPAIFCILSLPVLSQNAEDNDILSHDGLFSLRLSANVSRGMTPAQSGLPDGYSILTQPFFNGLGASFNYGHFISNKNRRVAFWETGIAYWSDKVALLDGNDQRHHYQRLNIGVPLTAYYNIPFGKLASGQQLDLLLGGGGMLNMDLRNFYGPAYQELQSISSGLIAIDHSAMNVEAIFDARFMLYGKGSNTHVFGIKTMFNVANIYHNNANTLAPLNRSPAVHTTTLYYNLVNISL